MPGSSADKAVKAVETPTKVMEKRRALGRGLESLLPAPQRGKSGLVGEPGAGPRVVTPAGPPTTAPVPASPASGTAQTVGVGTAVAASGAAASAAAVPTPGRADLQAAGSEDEAEITREHSAPDVPAPASIPAAERAETPVAPSLPSADEVVRLAIDLIDKNPHQTRRMFHEAELKELAESIRVQGVLQPIVVRPNGEGGFRLILGERRLRASRIAGIETIPAIVKRLSEQQAAEMTLVENLQRQDLNCLEQAEAFSNLSQKFGLTQEEIGKRVGMSREAVANYMRLLTLPESVLEALIGGRLTFSHARALMALKDPVEIWGLAKRAIEENLKVSDLEKLVKGIEVPQMHPQGSPRGARWVDPNVKAAQRSLEEVLGMRVRIQDKRGRGKIVIEYATIDDFDRVVGMLRGR